ncbi:hypothetical protein N7G274_006703 [Stereocaulon virgatum]|uniref:Uncharacterized protein n=1 Tax=Stereocaulon virgatum TaxID=373712 RepID=A0ABR4A487_9LECA
MPTDTIVSSTNPTSPLPANGKRQANPTISPIAIPSTFTTSTITAFPPGGSDKQKQQIRPRGSTPTDTALPLGASDHMVNIAVAGGSKILSALVAESTGADGNRELVFKKLGCAGKSGKDGSQRQRVKPSPQDSVIPDTATRTFDLGASTAMSNSGGKKNAVVPPYVGAKRTDTPAAAPTSLG